MKEKKLKDIIHDEIDSVTRLLISSNTYDDKFIMKKWLQSLQRIDDCCKNRNKY